MDLQLEGKRAVVTGGSRGIGLAIASALLAEGARVAVVARSESGIEAAANKLGAGPRVIGIAADTTSRSNVESMVRQVTEGFGGIDILVNGAAQRAGGKPERSLLQGFDEGGLRSDLDTKVFGYLRCAYAVAPGMVAQGWGRIINIGGVGARRTGHVSTSVRNVSVAAITKNLADELGPRGINVTAVHPGLTHIPFGLGDSVEADEQAQRLLAQRVANEVSIGRMITAVEVADVVVFLASPRSVAIHGDAILVAGGMQKVIYY